MSFKFSYCSQFFLLVIECGGILISAEGRISYNGPLEESVVGTDVRCVWTIRAAENRLIRLSVITLILDYNLMNCMWHDHLQVNYIICIFDIYNFSMKIILCLY